MRWKTRVRTDDVIDGGGGEGKQAERVLQQSERLQDGGQYRKSGEGHGRTEKQDEGRLVAAVVILDVNPQRRHRANKERESDGGNGYRRCDLVSDSHEHTSSSESEW